MEKLVTIINQFPLASRPYTAQDGTGRVFNSRGFILSDGIDEFYGEMVGRMASNAGLHQAAFVSRQERRDTV